MPKFSTVAPIPYCLLVLVTLADAAEIQYPFSIAVNSSGEIFLADRNLPGIWALKNSKPEVLFQASKRFRTPLNAVRCLEFDHQGQLLVGDSATRDIYRLDDDGQPQPLTREGDQFGQIGIPMDLAVNKSGDIYVSDLEIHRIVRVPSSGGKPEEVAAIQGCRGLFVDREDNLWVVSTTVDQLWKIPPGGEPEVVVKGRPFSFPHTVVVDGDGRAYVCDGFAPAIWLVEPDKEPTKLVDGSPLVRPVGMAISEETILVSDPHARKVFKISSDGAVDAVSFETQ